ncbi:TRAP transporter substrate-binding protein [Lentisalinibacter sediminis]|uniref:TRAP transporter substrate-binding protein n=1 Tax=Lentisalinibacter sediminis TaxID=2992237 RepID=UPI00386DDFAF
MRRVGAGVVGIALALLLSLAAGCGESTPDTSRVRVTALSPPGTPWHEGWLRFEERFQAGNDTDLELDMFVTGQLGSEETMLSSLRRGRVHIGGFSLQGLAVVVPELNVLLAPYLFDSVGEVDFVIDNYLTPAFRALFAAKGMELLQWAEVGWTHIYGLTPIIMPEDARDRPMRASNAIGSQVFTEAIGADSTPVTFSEVIPSLQTGLIESGQSGTGMYAIAGISREARHLTLTRHAFDTGLIVANRRWFRALSERKQAVIMNALDPLQYSRNDVRRVLANILTEQLPAQSVAVHRLDEEQRQRWRAAVTGTHETLLERVGGQAREIYRLVQEGKREWARLQEAGGAPAERAAAERN